MLRQIQDQRAETFWQLFVSAQSANACTERLNLATSCGVKKGRRRI